jgi:hypothetical protein
MTLRLLIDGLIVDGAHMVDRDCVVEGIRR